MANKPKTKVRTASTIAQGTGLQKFLDSTYPQSRKIKFSKKEKEKLRPIAETLAMMDGNAFFGISIDDDGDDIWYENYLVEAWRIYRANGGDNGWGSGASWIKEQNHENDSVKDAYQNWQLLKILSKKRQ
jgi:hypothetical protein